MAVQSTPPATQTDHELVRRVPVTAYPPYILQSCAAIFKSLLLRSTADRKNYWRTRERHPPVCYDAERYRIARQRMATTENRESSGGSPNP